MTKIKIICLVFSLLNLNVFASENLETEEARISELLDIEGWTVNLGVKQVKITDEMVKGFTVEELLEREKLKKDTRAKSNREEESNCCWKFWN